MKQQQGTLLFTIVLLATLFLGGCKSEIKEFSLSYSFESVDNYKVMISINNNKEYTIEKYNYFMDNHEGTRRPFVAKGSLADNEYRAIKTTLEGSRIFKMDDSYGFDKEADNDIGSIIYQVNFDADGKQKYITFRDNGSTLLPSSLIELTQQLNTLIKTHEQNEPGK